MSLLQPGLGDKYDRMTILARKIVERPERGDFIKEFETLDAETPVRPRSLVMLGAINAAIWQREDELRRLKSQTAFGVAEGDWHTLGRVAIQIQELNDRRAALIAELNGTPGEKLYK